MTGAAGAHSTPSPASTDVAGLRVLVVGINYAPEFTGIAPYTTQVAADLVAAGSEVLVLAGLPHYPQWTALPGYRRRVTKESRDGVPVRRLLHFVPSTQTAAKRGLYEMTFGLNVLTQRLPWKPDVVVAVSPSLFGAAAASVIARRTKAPFVLWLQDLLGPAALQSGISGGGRVAGATAALERWTIRRSSLIAVLNERFRSYVESSDVGSDRVVEIANWTHVTPPTISRDTTRAAFGWADDDVIVLHTGNMGLKQGLDNVVETARLAALQEPSVRFVLMGDGSQRRALERMGETVANLVFVPAAPAENYTEALAAADVLLISERGSVEDMSVPSKLTSYLSVDVPLVAAVRPDGATAAEIRRGGRGVLVAPADPAALLAGVVNAAGSRAVQPADIHPPDAHLTDFQATADYLHDHLSQERGLLAFRRLISRAAARSSGNSAR